MKVVVLGCKDFPAFKYGKDVGGIEVFCNDVLKRIKDIDFCLFVKKYKNAPKEDKIENIQIYRIPYVDFPLLRTVSFNFLAFFKVLKLKTDLIWAHEPSAGFFAYFLSKIKKIPYMLHIHSRGSLESGKLLRKLGLRFLESFAYKSPDKTIFVSENIKKELSKKGVFIPVGVDVRKFQNKNQASLLKFFKNNKKICFVGRLYEVKGIRYLILAFSKIENENIRLFIIGEGDQKRELKNLVKELKIQDKVVFLRTNKIESLFPFMDLFVLPSLSEGTPHTILEALACKIPIVASNVGEIPNLINQDYLVEPKNVEDLKDKILLALKEKYICNLDKKYLIENVAKKIEGELR
ncbi:hypothetical protein CL621_04200 [archaeon]|nr:hypothetical protein [archaeon]|tara:strand:+ start:807 stop:1856 length:1050 start_codon:yes stop_codon:yes gene_type:complete